VRGVTVEPIMPRALARSSLDRSPRASAPAARQERNPMPLGKRVLDLAIALPALILAAPFLLLAAMAVRATSQGPALFRQVRIGHGGRPFTMLKLRTMRAGDDEAFRSFNVDEILGRACPGEGGIYRLESDPRITPLGRWLRRYSLDEVPQLINVVRGEMSLVGPRPSLPFEVELYSPEQCRRHDCLPGITGLWQVSGRNRLSIQEMLALDLDYVERRSLWLDLQILWRTPRAVLLDHDTR
jgi:lipopolysaccharide/colanic/teichoic acid biosynthesis glycosyltransferase